MTLALQRSKLDNGLTVIVSERPKLPLVSLRLLVFSGSSADPEGHEGLASATAELLARGTRRWGADELNGRMEELGGRLISEAGLDSSLIGTTVPSENASAALAVLAEVAANPRFAPAEVSQARRRFAAEIENGLDDPSVAAGRVIRGLAFADHPYGHPLSGTLKAVSRLNRKHLVDFHATHFGPKNAALVVVGDVTAAAAADLADSALGKWRGQATRAGNHPPPKPLKGKKVVVVDKPSATQAQVRIASRCIARSSPDYQAGEVCATAFGGLFTSRLMQALRVDEGLTYGASCWLAAHAAGGAFYIQSSTRTDAVLPLLTRTLAEAARARDPGIGAEEIDRARTYMTASFPFDIETSPQVAQVAGEIAVFGLPDDYIETYPARVRAVTPEATTAFAKNYFPADDAAIVAVGEAKPLAKALSSFGPVKVMRLADVA